MALPVPVNGGKPQRWEEAGMIVASKASVDRAVERWQRHGFRVERSAPGVARAWRAVNG